MLAVVLAMFGVCWWFRTPGPDNYELPDVYTADNVRLYAMYDIVVRGRHTQTFVVENIRDGLFFFRVVPDDSAKRPEIVGWTDRLPSNRLIRRADLQAFPARLIGLETA
ncbi:MAG: hypothetical protein WAT84_01585 [Candidatus Moraniibacteriota bacterium]